MVQIQKTIERPDLHPTQQQVWDDKSRFKVLACGRRWGKTLFGCTKCVEVAVNNGRAWWIAPSYKLGRVGWRGVSHLMRQIPGAEPRRGEFLWTLPAGGTVQVRSADDPQSLRSEGLDLAVLDECAYMQEAAWIEALRPALSDRLGEAIFISTPHYRNWFWRLFQRGISGADNWNAWKFPTVTNPFIDPGEIEAARADMPADIFRQEYLAEFLEGEGAVFRNIAACMIAPETRPEEHEGHYKVAGIDWGKHNDFTVISVGCLDCHQEIALDRFNQIDYTFQRARLASLMQMWHVGWILAESNAMGEPIIEQLQYDGLPVEGFQTTASSKPPLIENLALTLEREEWQFLSIPVATAELEAYERKVSAQTGRSSYGAPEGLHDDTVIARALMRRAAGDGGPAIIEIG